MRYAQAIEYLYKLEPRGISLGLARVEKALVQRGSPQRAFQSVLVAGTNGKGSVSAMLASVLKESGLRVGLYTSPHLHQLVERFRVNGRTMPKAELARRVSALRAWVEEESTPPLTFFELCTVLAMEWFRDVGCDIVVLEVGLGGRLDATNVVTPVLSVITHVALDHQDRLGPTVRHIAREKAGIAKAGVPLVVGERDAESWRVIAAQARKVKAPMMRIDRDITVREQDGAYAVRVGADELAGLRIPLRGAYQRDNLACAVGGVVALRKRGVAISDAALRKGLARVKWPGRLELIEGAPDVLCDAAHNPDACEALAAHLAQLGERYRRKVLVFGVLRDKDYERMLQLLLPCFDEVVFGTPISPRSARGAELCQRFGGKAFDDPQRCLSYAQKRAGKRGLVVVAGSIVWMSMLRARVLGVREDPKIAL